MQPPFNKHEPGKANLSLVAYYGDKPPEIVKLITESQEILQSGLPHAFNKYDIRQVHATLISLEGHRAANDVINTNYARFCKERRIIDFSKAFRLLEDPDFLPFTVLIGGYKKRDDYPFTSRGMHPYLRSFSIQGDIAVAMGWPNDGVTYPATLNELRRAFNDANILHKYHRNPADIDNDFYFVLGNIDPELTSQLELQNVQNRMLEFLSNRGPLTVNVVREHLKVLAYVDPKSPLRTTRMYDLDEAEEKLGEIKSLYQTVAET